MTQKDKVRKHLANFGEISRGEAVLTLGIAYKSFSSIISELKKEGTPIAVRRNRLDYMQTTYVLCTEEDAEADRFKPRYNYTNNRRLWEIWRHMRERCDSPYHKSYADYGGRGISVCDEWEQSFEAFAEWAYANGYDDDAPFMQCTIDRIDLNGNYEPSNCRWATMKEQCNNRRNNRVLTHNGKSQTLIAWSEETKIPYSTLWRRINKGWSVERALTTPIKRQRNNRPRSWVAQ